MRNKIILGLLGLAIVVAGFIAFSAFTAQMVNVTARVEKEIALAAVTCTDPADIHTCVALPDGDRLDYGTVMPQETLDRFVLLTLSNSFREQSRVIDVQFDVLWECKQFENERDLVDNITGLAVEDDPDTEEVEGPGDGIPDCRSGPPPHTDADLEAIDTDGDGIPDTVVHKDLEVLDGEIGPYITLTSNDNQDCRDATNQTSAKTPAAKKVVKAGSGILTLGATPKCLYTLKLVVPACEGSVNQWTDPTPPPPTTIDCHYFDKNLDNFIDNDADTLVNEDPEGDADEEDCPEGYTGSDATNDDDCDDDGSGDGVDEDGPDDPNNEVVDIQGIDEFADLGSEFKIQVTGHSFGD